MTKELLSRKEVAEHFGVVPETVRRWEKSKVLLPCCNVMGKPRYSIKDIKNIAANKNSSEPVKITLNA
ncbi:MAG: MerR family regulatory protein [Segetibacter sp.]|nr:MerR family regulatory protein [Segetibacter sp.]